MMDSRPRGHAVLLLYISVSLVFRYQAALEVKAAADAAGKLMCWKGHSMGCYLLLNVVDRLRWKGEDMQALFREVILDAPDVPTWFFRSMVKVMVESFDSHMCCSIERGRHVETR